MSWAREIDPVRNKELRVRWTELSMEIVKLKCKESENGNDGRVSS